MQIFSPFYKYHIISYEWRFIIYSKLCTYTCTINAHLQQTITSKLKLKDAREKQLDFNAGLNPRDQYCMSKICMSKILAL